MSAVDETEHKDVRRLLQQQTTVSARVAAVEQANAVQHSSRPILKTLMRTQTPSQLAATNCSAPQKATHSSTLNATPSSLPQSSYVPRCASKVVTIRASSSNTSSSHALFKPYDFAQLSNPVAVMYQQLQQQQQIGAPPQQLVSLSMSRTRECDDRASRSPSVSQANGGMDSRYYSQISVPRMRPVVSRSSSSAFAQQSYPSNANVVPNASLRMNVTARSTDPADSGKNCSATQTSIVAPTSSAAQCTRYVPVNGYKPTCKGSVSLGNSSSSVLPVPEKGDTKQQAASSRSMIGVSVLASTNASSGAGLVLPQPGIIASQNSATNSNITPSMSTSHAGPSPRPSILRKIRDPSSAAGSAVRRLVMSDGASSRPASCTSSFSSSPVQLDDASCSTNTKCVSVGGEVRALSATPVCNYEQRIGQMNESNARYLHSTFTENVATAFTRVEGSPQRVSELDTPRKRLRKQQFDSSQAPDKIKMEVSVHVDANKIDYQKEEISLWRLAPAAQLVGRASYGRYSVPHGGIGEKGTKRRGRPRGDVRASNEHSTTSSVSPANSTVLTTCAPPRTKKARKGQTALGALEANATRAGFITDEGNSLDGRYAGSANFTSELPKRRLRVKAPRNTKSRRAAVAANETTEAETAAKTLSSLFQEIQRKKNDASSTPVRSRLRDVMEDGEMKKADERAPVEVACPVETEDACSFSSDISDVSFDFGSDERSRNTPTVSSKASKMNELSADNLHDNQADPLYKPRPCLLSGYKIPTNTMLSHVERPECTEAILDKVRMLKAAKNSLRRMQRSLRERSAARRVQLKRELFNRLREMDREGGAPSFVDGACVQKMTSVSTSELCASTTGFYKMLSRICPARRGSYEESTSLGALERASPTRCSSPFPVSTVPAPRDTRIECSTLRENTISPPKSITQSPSVESSVPLQRTAHPEFAVVVNVLATIIDRVVDWTDGNGGRCEGISGKVKKKRRRRTMRGVCIVDSTSIGPVDEAFGHRGSYDTRDKERYPQMQQSECGTSKVKEKGEGRKGNERHEARMLNGQCGEEAIDEQIRELNIALKNLNRKDYASRSFTSDPTTLFNATYERLLRVERDELENEANTMELMLDFLRVTNKQAHDQLMDDIERDCDSDDDESTREMKRRRRIVAFAVQVPRANPSLPKRDLYNATRSTNFHPTTADINELFGLGSSYYRGHLSANNDKAYVYLDRKGNRIKERFDVRRFKQYEFVPDAELDEMRLNLSADVLRNEYESKLGLTLTQYRFDDPENDTPLSANEKCKASLLAKSFDKLKIRESNGLAIGRQQHSAAEGRHSSAAEFDQQKEAKSNGAQMSSVIVTEEDGDVQVIGEKMVGLDVNLLDAGSDDAAAVNSCEEPETCSDTESDMAQCVSGPALTETERLHIERRADNIREMFATLLHTLRVNSYLASTAAEVFSEHAKEILARSAQPSTSPDESSGGCKSYAAVEGFSKERS